MASIEETQGLLEGIKAVPSSSIALDESEADAGVWLVRAVFETDTQTTHAPFSGKNSTIRKNNAALPPN